MCVVIDRGRPAQGQGNGVSLTRGAREITKICETFCGLTHWMGGDGEGKNWTRAGRTRQQMKLTHGNGIIAVILRISLQMGNTWRRWTLLILMGSKEDTLQSTLNKGKPMWECFQTVFYGVVSRDTMWYDLVDFWWAREGKCSMVLSILESLKAWRRLQWGLFFIGSLLWPKKDKSIHRRARPS